ncbi:hypothetical protein H7K28_12740 [Paenibacillus polymyxa]|jgi:hypothetical protein|nr:hypothetical protein [Paenibacillus polymyxa]KAF6616289.1 hypothetical protein HFE00_16885 [Paenibacillus sp. EKM101P]KAF6618035.1 hypothetical protein HFE03_23420 [Paenibacillus sp. EKM102P]KAF6626138.1 hypothetical protein HFE01_23020 [Paenibacillus sp. EKM10P]KAF6642608.1 hypothetical protein HFE02_23425 [Paenibacillus sp. EKM11P]APB73333.1 hypothetical protein PPYC1_07305 [Paenibacillus polymyxa]
MNLDEVNVEIDKINTYLSRCLWMDFEFCRMNAGQIVLSGSIDQSSDEYAIDIEFEQPYFVSTLFLWHGDTSKIFIELANDEEAMEMNQKYNVEFGNYIFKISVEGFDSPPIIIVAKKISCKILNDNPFPKS